MQNIIAIVFDFDGTLAPDSTSGYLVQEGLKDIDSFWSNEVAPLIDDDWELSTSYLYNLLKLSNSGRIPPITKDKLAAWGPKVPIYEGVNSIFSRLRMHLESIDPGISLEFYCISGGVVEILRHTKIAKNFTDIWGCEFTYDDCGRILFPKKVVNCTGKTRYLFHISKGIIGDKYLGKPFQVHKSMEKDKLRIPMNQMIMVGDGYTDIPCFAVVKGEGGIAIGVHDSGETYSYAWGAIESKKVSHLVPVDYNEGSALVKALKDSLTSIASKIKTQVVIKT